MTKSCVFLALSAFLLVITSLCSAVSFSENSNFLQVQHLLQNASGKALIYTVANRISNHIKYLQNPSFPLLPLLPGYPFPDNVCYNPTTLEATLVELGDLKVDLKIDFNTKMVTTGLESLKDVITFKVMPSGSVVVFWKLELPLLEMLADYDLNLSILNTADPSTDITFHIGSTNADLKSDNYYLSLFAEAKAFPLNENLTLTQLNWDTNFPEMTWNADWLIELILADGTHTEIINEPGDIGGDVVGILKLIWNGVATVDLHCFINFVINECAVSQLVNEDYGCLRWDIENSKCFNNPIENGIMGIEWGKDLEFTPCSTPTTPTTPGTTPTTPGSPTTPTTPSSSTTVPTSTDSSGTSLTVGVMSILMSLIILQIRPN